MCLDDFRENASPRSRELLFSGKNVSAAKLNAIYRAESAKTFSAAYEKHREVLAQRKKREIAQSKAKALREENERKNNERLREQMEKKESRSPSPSIRKSPNRKEQRPISQMHVEPRSMVEVGESRQVLKIVDKLKETDAYRSIHSSEKGGRSSLQSSPGKPRAGAQSLQ